MSTSTVVIQQKEVKIDGQAHIVHVYSSQVPPKRAGARPKPAAGARTYNKLRARTKRENHTERQQRSQVKSELQAIWDYSHRHDGEKYRQSYQKGIQIVEGKRDMVALAQRVRM